MAASIVYYQKMIKLLESVSTKFGWYCLLSSTFGRKVTFNLLNIEWLVFTYEVKLIGNC